jgi:hypothetical protein
MLSMSLRTHPSIKVVTRPERAAAAEKLVGGMRSERFPAVNHARKRPPVHLQRQDVDVRRHHAPSLKLIALPVEVPKRVTHNAGNARISEAATSNASIKSGLRRQKPILWLGVSQLFYDL